MTGEPGANGAPRPPADERAQGQDLLGLGERERDALLAWVGENLTVVQRSASGQRVLYWILGIGFVVGLAADVGGFLLKNAVTTEPLLVVGDLLYTLGWALWTGAVVVVFVQIYPEAKKRQYKQALAAYEAAVGRRAGAGSRQASDPATEEAVARYRELAEVNPGRYRPDLAWSLGVLAHSLDLLGRGDDASAARSEAAALTGDSTAAQGVRSRSA
jgi:hypothetical protein